MIALKGTNVEKKAFGQEINRIAIFDTDYESANLLFIKALGL